MSLFAYAPAIPWSRIHQLWSSLPAYAVFPVPSQLAPDSRSFIYLTTPLLRDTSAMFWRGVGKELLEHAQPQVRRVSRQSQALSPGVFKGITGSSRGGGVSNAVCPCTPGSMGATSTYFGAQDKVLPLPMHLIKLEDMLSRSQLIRLGLCDPRHRDRVEAKADPPCPAAGAFATEPKLEPLPDGHFACPLYRSFLCSGVHTNGTSFSIRIKVAPASRRTGISVFDSPDLGPGCLPRHGDYGVVVDIIRLYVQARRGRQVHIPVGQQLHRDRLVGGRASRRRGTRGGGVEGGMRAPLGPRGLLGGTYHSLSRLSSWLEALATAGIVQGVALVSCDPGDSDDGTMASTYVDLQDGATMRGGLSALVQDRTLLRTRTCVSTASKTGRLRISRERGRERGRQTSHARQRAQIREDQGYAELSPSLVGSTLKSRIRSTPMGEERARIMNDHLSARRLKDPRTLDAAASSEGARVAAHHMANKAGSARGLCFYADEIEAAICSVIPDNVRVSAATGLVVSIVLMGDGLVNRSGGAAARASGSPFSERKTRHSRAPMLPMLRELSKRFVVALTSETRTSRGCPGGCAGDLVDPFKAIHTEAKTELDSMTGAAAGTPRKQELEDVMARSRRGCWKLRACMHLQCPFRVGDGIRWVGPGRVDGNHRDVAINPSALFQRDVSAAYNILLVGICNLLHRNRPPNLRSRMYTPFDQQQGPHAHHATPPPQPPPPEPPGDPPGTSTGPAVEQPAPQGPQPHTQPTTSIADPTRALQNS